MEYRYTSIFKAFGFKVFVFERFLNESAIPNAKEVLLLFMKMSLPTKIAKSVRAQSRFERDEAARLSKEIHGFVQPLLDWYQFEGRGGLVHFVVDELTFSPEHSLEEIKVPYKPVESHVFGKVRAELSDDLKRIHSYMRRLLESAEAGNKERVIIDAISNPEYRRAVAKGHRWEISQYISPNREPLHDLVGRAFRELVGEGQEKAIKSIESRLGNETAVKRPSGLISRLFHTYSFANLGKLHDFMSEFTNVPPNYYLRDVKGLHKIPSNYHRKLFAVALVLDYAAEHEGLKEKVISAILEREKQQRKKEGKRFEYLTVNRPTYLKLIREMESKGLTGNLLGAYISQLMGITIENAVNDYIAGRNFTMGFANYRLLQKFNDKFLPKVTIVNLRDAKTRSREYDRFMQNYTSGRVLVITTTLVTPTGFLSQEYKPLLNSIITKVKSELGFSYLFPGYKSAVPGLEHFLPYKELLKFSDFDISLK